MGNTRKGRWIRGERAQTTLNASFGPLVSLFFLFFRFLFLLTNNIFTVMLRNTRTKVEMRIMGPNDAKRVVWANNGWGSRRVASRAPGMFLLFLFTISYFTNVFLGIYYIRHRTGLETRPGLESRPKRRRTTSLGPYGSHAMARRPHVRDHLHHPAPLRRTATTERRAGKDSGGREG